MYELKSFLARSISIKFVSVDGNPVLIKVWKASEEMEYVITATWSAGSGIFGDLILAVSELEIAAEMSPTVSINEFFFRKKLC